MKVNTVLDLNGTYIPISKRLTGVILHAIFNKIYGKPFCAGMLQKMLSDTAQIHSGYRDMMECPIQRYRRDRRLFAITDGTAEVQHLIIANETLR